MILAGATARRGDVMGALAWHPTGSRRQPLAGTGATVLLAPRGARCAPPPLAVLTIHGSVFPVQAGVSLRKAPHLIERGLSPTVAATIVSTFSRSRRWRALRFALFARRLGIRISLALAGAFAAACAVLMLSITAPIEGYIAASCFGATSASCGRANVGPIRGAALTCR